MYIHTNLMTRYLVDISSDFNDARNDCFCCRAEMTGWVTKKADPAYLHVHRRVVAPYDNLLVPT